MKKAKRQLLGNLSLNREQIIVLTKPEVSMVIGGEVTNPTIATISTKVAAGQGVCG